MLEETVFLSADQIIDLHNEGIKRFSPSESLSLRDRGLLESAVMAPQQTFDGYYLYGSIEAMAAAYLIGLAFNHAFENGNKRVAFSACSTFLRMNGYQIVLTQTEAVDLTLGVLNHEIDREDVIATISDALHVT